MWVSVSVRMSSRRAASRDNGSFTSRALPIGAPLRGRLQPEDVTSTPQAKTKCWSRFLRASLKINACMSLAKRHRCTTSENKQENAWVLGKGMIMKTRAALRLIAKQPELLDAIRQIKEHSSKSSKNQVNLGALLSTGEVMMAAVAVHALLASTFASLSKNKEDGELTFHSVTSLVRATPRLEYKGYNNTSHGGLRVRAERDDQDRVLRHDRSVVLSYRLELLRGNPNIDREVHRGYGVQQRGGHQVFPQKL